MNVTVDASVFLSALHTNEPNSPISRQCLQELARQQAALFCPAIVTPECAGSVARASRSLPDALQAAASITGFGNITLVELNAVRAANTTQIAAQHRLRGADACYVAVAAEFGAVLVTWDVEMLQRGASAVTTQTPADWLARNLPPTPPQSPTP